MRIITLMRQVARLNWWSGFVTAMMLTLFFQDLVGAEVYAGMILYGSAWVATPVWIWPVAIILLNAFVIWITSKVWPVRHPVKELKSDHRELFDKVKGDDDDEDSGIPPPEALV